MLYGAPDGGHRSTVRGTWAEGNHNNSDNETTALRADIVEAY